MNFWKIMIFALFETIVAQHENIPYSSLENICQSCSCMSAKDHNNVNHFILNCQNKNLEHILARWPNQFGSNHSKIEILATFSQNKIHLLQQLPATEAKLSFSCRHCKIQEIQSPTFLDCPNVFSVDLSWNELTQDALIPDIFRGPYNEQAFEPIKLKELYLSHNLINDLDSKLFEHTIELEKLDLSFNKFDKLDAGAIQAINGARNLKYLDMSYNAIKILPEALFTASTTISSLYFQKNYIINIPKSLKFVSKALEFLDLSYNLIEEIESDTFGGFEKLKYLNISGMDSLRNIEVSAFSTLTALEELYCANNYDLIKFHLPTESTNLRILDISNCNLNSLILDIDILNQYNESNYINYWPILTSLNLAGNPWNCDCTLVKIYQQYEDRIFQKDVAARCSSPFEFSGAKLDNLRTDQVCNVMHNEMIETPTSKYNPPYFLRPKSLSLTVITICIVITIGICIGFLISYGRKKLKTDLILHRINPIRYTTVNNT